MGFCKPDGPPGGRQEALHFASHLSLWADLQGYYYLPPRSGDFAHLWSFPFIEYDQAALARPATLYISVLFTLKSSNNVHHFDSLYKPFPSLWPPLWF